MDALTEDRPLRNFVLGMRMKLSWELLQHPITPLIYFGGTKHDQDRDKVKELLAGRGVPQGQLAARVDQVFQQIPGHRLQPAIRSKMPWPALKKVAQEYNLRLVQPEELEAHIELRKQKGPGINHKVREAQWVAPRAADLQLQPGWFIHPDGTPAQQLSIEAVHENASGVALIDPEAADAWHHLAGTHKKPLLFLFLGCPDEAIQGVERQVPATFTPTQEKVLVVCKLVQMGPSGQSIKEKQQHRVNLQLDTTACIKLVWYRDSVEEDWAQLCQAPIRHLLDTMEWTKTCLEIAEGCQCGRFHPDQSHERPIISLWDRQWLTHQWEKQSPQKADTFQVMARVPSSCLSNINACTGQNGFYAEPRAADGRGQATEYVVIWIPGGTNEKMRALKAMDSRVLAVARSGTRYGIRCDKANGPVMWAAHKPGQQWLDPMTKLTFVVGPLPRGVSKQTLQAVVKGIGWQARPVQPHHSSAEGVFWAFVANTKPSQECVEVDGKLVTIVPQADHKPPAKQPVLIAPKETKEFLASPGEAGATDPLQANDPWARKSHHSPAAMPTPIKNALNAIAQRQATPVADPRVAALEERMTKMEQEQQQHTEAVQEVKRRSQPTQARHDPRLQGL